MDAQSVDQSNRQDINLFSLNRSKMIIFRTVRNKYAMVGISSSNQWTQKYSFNKRVCFGFLLFGCVAVSQLVYVFYVANGLMEYMECISTGSGTIIMFVCFAAIVFRKTKLFESIDEFEKLIDTSDSISNFNL